LKANTVLPYGSHLLSVQAFPKTWHFLGFPYQPRLFPSGQWFIRSDLCGVPPL